MSRNSLQIATWANHCGDRATLQWDTALPDMLVATGRLKRALQHGAAAVLDAAGLTVAQWLILCHLQQVDAATLTDIAIAIHHDAGALSRAAYPLQQRQLVTASRQPRDRRTVRLSISQAGAALYRALETQLGERLNRTLDHALGSDGLREMLQWMEVAAASLESPQH